MPYSLIRTLADTTKITDNIATKQINQSINQVQQGLTGANTRRHNRTAQRRNGITQNLERQRGQISSVLEFSNEYIRELNNNREPIEYISRGSPF